MKDGTKYLVHMVTIFREIMLADWRKVCCIYYMLALKVINMNGIKTFGVFRVITVHCCLLHTAPCQGIKI